MGGDQYIVGVLAKYGVPTGLGSGVAAALGQVIPSLKLWANQYLNSIGPSGSFAKGTAVAGATDVDVFISIKNSVPEDLEEIYESLYKWADERFWIPRRQNVSIGISWLGTKVDLVPGRVQGILTTDHSLWKNKQHTWKQTNITTHINTVRNSGRVNEIRALKIWRQCYNLDFPSFYLELTVIDALWGKPKGVNLAANVSTSLEYIRDNLETACVIDPANTNNVDLRGPHRRREKEDYRAGWQEPQGAVLATGVVVNENRLHELYTNLQKRLASDLDAARSANKNANAKGDESELTWLKLFDEHLPHRYRSAKGIVIDCDGAESDAIDIIIYDRQYTPVIYNQQGYLYHSGRISPDEQSAK